MSVVIAIKEKGRVYMGCDSQVTSGGTRTTLKNPNNYKIWKVGDVEGCLMGSVGDLRDACVVRTADDLVTDYDVYRDRVNYRFVVHHVLPQIIDILSEAKYIDVTNGFSRMQSSFLFAYKDRLFNIHSDGSVIEIDDYVAIGSGKNEAIGSLLSTEGQSPETRIVKAIKASAANDLYVDYPILLIDSDQCEFTVITEKTEKDFLGRAKKKEGPTE